MPDKTEIHWLPEPEAHDYPAAASYLNLLYDPVAVAHYTAQLQKAPMSSFKAKDILRASGLKLLDTSNAHVLKDRKKITDGNSLSPLLLVRQAGVRVIVADGYHRLCAVYGIDEDASIPCKIV